MAGWTFLAAFDVPCPVMVSLAPSYLIACSLDSGTDLHVKQPVLALGVEVRARLGGGFECGTMDMIARKIGKRSRLRRDGFRERHDVKDGAP